MPKKANNTTFRVANWGNTYQDQSPVEHETLDNGSLALERERYTSVGSSVSVS